VGCAVAFKRISKMSQLLSCADTCYLQNQVLYKTFRLTTRSLHWHLWCGWGFTIDFREVDNFTFNKKLCGLWLFLISASHL